MADKKPQATENLVERWRRVGPELDRIRRQELREYKHEDNIEIIDSLLQLGCDLARPRATSGLVELQKILAKARR